MALSFGMPAGFADLINRKYNILQQDATARSNVENAQANSENIRSQYIPGEEQAGIAKTQADTALTNTTTRWMPRMNLSDIAVRLATARNLAANSNSTDINTAAARQDLGGPNNPTPDYGYGLQGYIPSRLPSLQGWGF